MASSLPAISSMHRNRRPFTGQVYSRREKGRKVANARAAVRRARRSSDAVRRGRSTGAVWPQRAKLVEKLDQRGKRGTLMLERPLCCIAGGANSLIRGEDAPKARQIGCDESKNASMARFFQSTFPKTRASLRKNSCRSVPPAPGHRFARRLCRLPRIRARNRPSGLQTKSQPGKDSSTDAALNEESER